MQLKQFHSENLLNVQEQALQYLFFTKQFDKHYQVINQFQEFHQVSFTNPGDVYCYIHLLQQANDFSSSVLANGYLYVQRKREIFSDLTQEEREKQNRDINQIIFLLQSYALGVRKNTFLQNIFPENSQLYRILDNYHVLREEKRNCSCEDLFLTTKMLLQADPLNPDDENLDLFFWNPDFLDYCSALLDYAPSLFFEPDFSKVVLSILNLNQTPEGFSSVFEQKAFVRQNAGVQRRLSKLLSYEENT